MNWYAVQQVFGNALVSAMVMAISGGAWKIYQDKRKRRRIDDRDANERLNDIQAAIEDHILNYDAPMRDRVMRHESRINQLLVESGHKPDAFDPLPATKPLFPSERMRGDDATR